MTPEGGAGGGDDPLSSTTDPGTPRSAIPRTLAWVRRFAKVWGFALFCIFVVYVFRDVALPFLFAILLAYVLGPMVDRMSAWRIGSRTLPRGAAVLILYVNLIAILVFTFAMFIPKLSGDFARLFREAPQISRRLNEEWVPRAGQWVDRYLGAGPPAEKNGATKAAVPPTASAFPTETPAVASPPVPAPTRRELIIETLPDGKQRVSLEGLSLEIQPAAGGGFLVKPSKVEEAESETGGRWERAIKHKIEELVESSEDLSKSAFRYGQKFVSGIITGIARMFLVLMVAAFILIDLQRIRGFLRSLVPEPFRNDYDRIAVGVDHGLAGVIRGQLFICLINGVLTYIGLLIFDVKYSLLLGLVAGIMSLVPIFGSILSSIPIVGIALISDGSLDISKALLVLGWICLIHLIEANVLNPKIMGGAAKIHPVLVVFALIAGEHSYGVVGALFAVPAASIIQTIFVYYRRRARRAQAE